jgi:hypothetical protein
MARPTLFKARLLSPLFIVAIATVSNSQTQPTTSASDSGQTQTQSKTQIVETRVEEEPLRVAGASAMSCAGYIRLQRLPKSPEIVGGEQEQEQRSYASGDIVYVNGGKQQGLQEGQHFQVIRPRGDVKGVYRQKEGYLGTYIQEVGQIEIFKVHENTSVAQVTLSCEEILLGDLLMPVTQREAPLERTELEFDRFADPTGKPNGRLMMAKGNRELLSRTNVVYIDLGSEDKVRAGDYLTIYRPLGTGNLRGVDNEESARGRADGFQSDTYRGGGFGLQAARAKDSTAFVNAEGRYRYKPITSREVWRNRPSMPRKIVGEMVIIDVQTRTATAIITKTVAEVHTGDWVEIQ